MKTYSSSSKRRLAGAGSETETVVDVAMGDATASQSGALEQIVEPVATNGRITARGLLRELVRDKTALVALIFLLLIVLSAILAPVLAPHDPATQSLTDRFTPPVWQEGGNWTFPLGTDALGRDFLSRILFGGRTSMGIGASVVLIGAVFGTIAGVLAGYRGGRTDLVIMRVIDLQMAFPGLLLILLVISVVESNPVVISLLLSLLVWHVFARHMRAAVLSARSQLFVEAAKMLGASTSRILRVHILPNIVSPLITLMVLSFATIILAESSLSFLGLGVKPPDTSWGLEISNGRQYIYNAWWLVVLPGVAIALTVLSSNIIVNWLRVALDAKERSKASSGKRAAIPETGGF